jgi:uncharacterized membrane protein required for colicin V production
MNLDALPFNTFDVLLVVILGAGLYHGRKAGMSGELLSMAKWLAIVFVCAVAYQPVGAYFVQSTDMFSTLSCYLMAYVGSALIIILIFAGINRALGGKLLGSDLFGGAEYYLGMGSGLVTYACILLAGLALLNARFFPSSEVKAMERFQNDVYGSNFFPGLHSVQASVFERSLTGPFIKEYLNFFLIKPTEPEQKELHQKDAKF